MVFGWNFRWSNKFRVGTVRYCHPVHQLVVNLGFAYVYRFVERDPTPQEWDSCPAWRNLKQSLKAAEERELEIWKEYQINERKTS